MGDLSICVDQRDARRLQLRGDASGTELQAVHDAAVAVLDASPSELIIDVNGVTAVGPMFVELLRELARRAAQLQRSIVLQVADAEVEWLSTPISPAIRIERMRSAAIWTAVKPRPLDVQTSAGAPRREGTGFVTSYGPGRRCASHGCSTTLSRYNSDPMCWIHSPDSGTRRG